MDLSRVVETARPSGSSPSGAFRPILDSANQIGSCAGGSRESWLTGGHLGRHLTRELTLPGGGRGASTVSRSLQCSPYNL
jgi:hypothetical protein